MYSAAPEVRGDLALKWKAFPRGFFNTDLACLSRQKKKKKKLRAKKRGAVNTRGRFVHR